LRINQRQRLARPTGFTMVELAMILFILSLLVAIGAPRYAGATNTYRVNMAAKKVAADLAMARNDAWIRGVHRTVTFTPSANQYQLTGVTDMNKANADTVVRLSDSPYNATLGSASFGGQPSVVFDGYGVPNAGGQIVISSGTFQKTVVVDGTNGNITIP
jgi:Tfp pilus assembly protein FimT